VKYIVNLTPQLEDIYLESSKMLGIDVNDVLEIVLAEYVANMLPKTREALN
jgi:hypothetical protein